MKRTLYLGILLLQVIIFNSCKKDEVKNQFSESFKKPGLEVNSWLDSKKSQNKPNLRSNIDLLQENLDFSKQRYEDYEGGDKLLIIPVNKQYNSTEKVDQKNSLVLVAVV